MAKSTQNYHFLRYDVVWFNQQHVQLYFCGFKFEICLSCQLDSHSLFYRSVSKIWPTFNSRVCNSLINTITIVKGLCIHLVYRHKKVIFLYMFLGCRLRIWILFLVLGIGKPIFFIENNNGGPVENWGFTYNLKKYFLDLIIACSEYFLIS